MNETRIRLVCFDVGEVVPFGRSDRSRFVWGVPMPPRYGPPSPSFKPAAASWSLPRLADRQLGYAGAEILFLDDIQENVAAARQVGWNAQLIDPAAPTAAQIISVLRSHGVGGWSAV